MTLRREWKFPSRLDAADFVASLDAQGIHRRAWHCEDQVEVVLEDDRKKSLVDDLAINFDGEPIGEWTEHGR